MDHPSLILAIIAVLGSGGFGLFRVKSGLELDVALKLLGLAFVQTTFGWLVAWANGWTPSPDALFPAAVVCAVFWFAHVLAWELLGPAFIAGYAKLQIKPAEAALAVAEEKARMAQEALEAKDEALRLANARLVERKLLPVYLGPAGQIDLHNLTPAEVEFVARKRDAP